ncbi:hypothetical protein MAXJ12_35701 [Mesorhizobium alhagi CCNWXJ12-2]|uniref:Uncharacterized protein n=1 Tax=Mesorhizobium alhagi CCNWXJ12-2 TaxID=1107882 RepID=H0I3S5_9HYPH|nr:hypothetical protein MAXJ12_35701 [Mesorhizobium alhagi CCNWXJ12-2]
MLTDEDGGGREFLSGGRPNMPFFAARAFSSASP